MPTTYVSPTFGFSGSPASGIPPLNTRAYARPPTCEST
nr:MAG TPA: hypothetical protein [Bacteriophage sp.]